MWPLINYQKYFLFWFRIAELFAFKKILYFWQINSFALWDSVITYTLFHFCYRRIHSVQILTSFPVFGESAGFIPHSIRQKCRISFHIIGKSAGFHSKYSAKKQGFIPHIRWGRTDPFHVFSERHTVNFNEGAKICKAAGIFSSKRFTLPWGYHFRNIMYAYKRTQEQQENNS